MKKYTKIFKKYTNTPGIRGWSSLCDRILVMQKKMRENHFFLLKKDYQLFLDIPSSYAEIWGKINCQSREFPRSGWKAKGVKRKKKKKVGENNGQLRFRPHHGWYTQAAWTNSYNLISSFFCSDNICLSQWLMLQW